MKKSVIVYLFIIFSIWAAPWRPTAAEPTASHPSPALLYSTLYGGSLTERAKAIAIDDQGRLYLTGSTLSTQFPSDGRRGKSHGVDAYVARFNAAATAVDYLFWFNATVAADVDEAADLVIDASGSAYIIGHTRSADFCTLFGPVPGYDTSYNGNDDIFILKARPDGSGLVYCTFLGGSDLDLGQAIAVDAAGSVYLAGSTWSNDFPVSAAAYDGSPNGLRDIFVARLDASGTQLTYGTYLGGSGQEEVLGLALGQPQAVYLAGWTNSADFPTVSGSYSLTYGGEFDGFAAQLDLAQAKLVYSSYLGGTGEDRITAVEERNGRLTVAGYTFSTDFPTTTATTPQGGSDAFLATFNPVGSTLERAMLVGGSQDDQVLGLAGDPIGAFYLTGRTASANFPTTPDGYDRQLAGAEDAFVVQLMPQGTAVRYSTFLGGQYEDSGLSIAADGLGAVYVAGTTRSTDFPTTPGVIDITPNGDYDIFATRLPITVPPPPHFRYLPAVARR